jgi:hypothetical protein
MATQTILYGTETAFNLASNLNSLASAAAKPLGAVDNSSTLGVNYKWKVKVTLPAASVVATGTVEVWLIESQLDTTTSAEWSDALNPAGTADIAASLKASKQLAVVPANAVNQVVTIQGELVGPQLSDCPKFWTLVVVNKCGVALGASGHAATFTSIKYSVA